MTTTQSTEISSHTRYALEQLAYDAADKNVRREVARVLANPTRETLRGTCSLGSCLPGTDNPEAVAAIKADMGWV